MIDAAEDGGGGAAFFDEVVGGFADLGEGVEGIEAEGDVAEGGGGFGEGADGLEVSEDGLGAGEGEEVGGGNAKGCGEGGKVEVVGDEEGEKVVFSWGEGWEWGGSDHEHNVVRCGGEARGWMGIRVTLRCHSDCRGTLGLARREG